MNAEIFALEIRTISKQAKTERESFKPCKVFKKVTASPFAATLKTAYKS